MPTLNWLTRKDDIKASGQVPYRILESVEKGIYGQLDSGSLLIQGDNLDALKSLLPFYAGSVKCIFIDPPYNTRKDFEHYQDNLEHTQWLEMMYPRLELLCRLLADNGSIWVIIDDEEGHYLKVLMDEVFGRRNFVANVVWQKRTSPDVRLGLSVAQDNIFVYAGNLEKFKPTINKLGLSEEQKKAYKNLDNDPRGAWVSTDFTGQTGHATPNQYYTLKAPNGKEHSPPAGRCWALAESTFYKLVDEGRVWFGRDGNARPRLKRYLCDNEGVNAWTWWTNKEVGHNQEGKKEMNILFGADNQFDTPKPERLIQRILQLATQPNDLVLDSFLGSGTTAAVAHKMNRRWIGIEMGEHAHTHCVPRLEKVIAGEQGGISKAVNWQGGGGFRFLRLGETIFLPDGDINPQITFAGLAAHLWFAETRTPFDGANQSPFLGVHDNTGYALLYNGILRDKKANGGNVLTTATLDAIRRDAPDGFDGPVVVYANGCRFSQERMRAENLKFKQLPYDCEQR